MNQLLEEGIPKLSKLRFSQGSVFGTSRYLYETEKRIIYEAEKEYWRDKKIHMDFTSHKTEKNQFKFLSCTLRFIILPQHFRKKPSPKIWKIFW